MADRVATPKQLAERVGLKERAIRRLINAGELDSVRIGARDFIPVDAWGVFIGRKRREKKACQDETKAQSCDGLQIAEPIMSPDGTRSQPQVQHWHVRQRNSSSLLRQLAPRPRQANRPT
jgi:excisionase family DNA binding protein